MKLKKIRLLMTTLCAVLIVFGITPSASALIINANDYPVGAPWPPTPDPRVFVWGYAGASTSNAAIESKLAALIPGFNATPLYEVGGTENPNLTITQNVPGGLWLLVKDGNSTPSWYAFNLSVAPNVWNGTDDIYLQNFWPNQGAISHVAIYGTPVPEPLTLLLVGFGLAGLSGVRRFVK